MCDTHSSFYQRWMTVAATLVTIAGVVGSAREASAQDGAKTREELRKELNATEQSRLKELRGDFARPLGEDGQDAMQEAEAAGAHNVSIVMQENNNGQEYSVNITNGKTTVERDGKKLSKDEYRIRGGKVEFLDGDGNVEHTMTLPNVQNNSPRAFFQLGRPGAMPIAPVAPVAPIAPPPPVMLGITMSDNDEGAMIDTVREGLPADKAGIKEGDIIVKVGTKRVSDQSDVRAALKTHKDGDKVDVIVLRDGERKTIGVELDAWDAEKLGVETAEGFSIAPEDGVGNWRRLDHDDISKHFAENWLSGGSRDTIRAAREALEEALDAVDGAKDDIEELRQAARGALEGAIKSLKEAELQSGQGGLRLFTPDGEGGEGHRLVIPRVEVQRERANQDRNEARGQADEMRKALEEVRKEMQELRKQVEEDAKKKDGR